MKECLICRRVFGDHIERCDRDRSPLKLTLPGLPIIADRYRLDERIGQGSLGMVYRGAEIGGSRKLAIKLISPEMLQADETIAQVLYQEVEAVKNIEHANIARIYDYGQTPANSLFIVMEYLEGCTLGVLMEQEPEIELSRCLKLIKQLCNALSAMHDRGHLHWDLNPGNIFVVYNNDGSELIKVVDFGLARIKTMELCNFMPGARTQNLLRLPYYISPEQCEGEPINSCSEVYSLGIIFYQLLTGRLPFSGATYQAIMQQHLHQPPPSLRALRSNLPDAVETILMRALEKSPKDRFQTPQAFAKMLKAATTHAQDIAIISGAKSVAPAPARPAPSQPASMPVELVEARQMEAQDILNELTRLLGNSLRASKFLTSAEVNPKSLVAQIAEQFERKCICKDGELYVPHLIKVLVPRTHIEKLKEIEVIFNSVIVVGSIYRYARKVGYRLFSLVKLDIEMIDAKDRDPQCRILIEWPPADNVSNGLEKVVQVERQKIVSTQLPQIQIPRYALLQPINASAYQEQFLITRKVTYMGRFSNVFDHETNQLLRRNDLSFLQPGQTDSPNTSISRQHAKIEFIDNQFYLFDIGSTNGTSIIRRENGARQRFPLEAMNATGMLLRDRDIIQLGLALISFEILTEDKISSVIEQSSAQQSFPSEQGSTADLFRTAIITTSITSAVVW